MTADPHSLGFRGLLDAGHDPRRGVAGDPRRPGRRAGALAIIRDLDRTPEGQQTLAWSRRQWASHGLPPPWEERQ